MVARQKRGSTLRAQWLGHMLRRERERSKITNKRAGQEIQRDGSTLSRIEAGISPARTADVLLLARLYHTPAELRSTMEQLSREIWRTGWWEEYTEHVADNFIDHAWLEDRAERLDWFEVVTIPGLFQIEQYTREAVTCAAPDAGEPQLEKWVTYRMDRQRVLDKESPPAITAILDEAAIRRVVGGVRVMHEQLGRLIELASRPNIDIHVIPFTAGMHAAPDGNFTVIGLPTPFPPVVHTQSAAGATYLEHDDTVGPIAAFARLAKLALDSKPSMTLIKRAIHDLGRTQ